MNKVLTGVVFSKYRPIVYFTIISLIICCSWQPVCGQSLLQRLKDKANKELNKALPAQTPHPDSASKQQPLPNNAAATSSQHASNNASAYDPGRLPPEIHLVSTENITINTFINPLVFNNKLYFINKPNHDDPQEHKPSEPLAPGAEDPYGYGEDPYAYEQLPPAVNPTPEPPKPKAPAIQVAPPQPKRKIRFD